MKLKLYTADLSPFGGRCRMAVELKGLGDQVECLSPPAPLGSPEWRRINPIGKLPVLETEAGFIAESEVILEYLEDRFPDPPLRPADLQERARARLLSRIVDLYVFEPLYPLFGQMSRKGRDQPLVDMQLAKLNLGLDRLDAWLPDVDGPYALGPEPTTADCALVNNLFFIDRILPAFDLPDPLTRTPAVSRYWRRATAEPVGARAVEVLQRGLDSYVKSGSLSASAQGNA